MKANSTLRACLTLATIAAASAAFSINLKQSSQHASHKDAAHAQEMRRLYLNTLKRSLTGVLLQTPRYAPAAMATTAMQQLPFSLEMRTYGQDWPVQGLTMVGLKRLDNLDMLSALLFERGVPGDFVECGVWRGGASIFTRALLKAHDIRDRTVHLVDSFDGLPKASTAADDDHWHAMEYLKVPMEDVKGAFERYHLLDDQVRFHRGYFRNSLPVLREAFVAEGRRVALLRMDGDMYESSMDILFNLADLLAPGACVVVDDWSIPPCQAAVREFLVMHGLAPEIIPIDQTAAYFCLESAPVLNATWYEDFNARRTPS